MPNLTRRITTPHLRWTLACVSTGHPVTSVGTDLLVPIPVLASYTCTPCAMMHFSPLCWRLEVTQHNHNCSRCPERSELPHAPELWRSRRGLGDHTDLTDKCWVPEALGYVVLGGDTTVSVQEDQVQLKSLRTGSEWWSKCVSNPPTHRVTAESRSSKCRRLPVLHLYCWLCEHVRLGVQKYWVYLSCLNTLEKQEYVVMSFSLFNLSIDLSW